MPRERPPGVSRLDLEIATAVRAALDGFVKERGESLRAVVEMAILRHLAYPPAPRPLDPLPPDLPPMPPPALRQYSGLKVSPFRRGISNWSWRASGRNTV